MVRAPCCVKMGLKKGPWTPEEDQILISYIQTHGHSNWRALPKQAGLLRCGKSCRLRWVNYLQPDIKRGNFTKEEEETIIHLHEMLGNRWSAIAARLPGRTDNEIKNVWHTHLKKRLKQNGDPKPQQYARSVTINSKQSEPTNWTNSRAEMIAGYGVMSPQPSSSDQYSSVTDTSSTNSSGMIKAEYMDSSEIFPVIDENFWSEPEVAENNFDNIPSTILPDDLQIRLPSPSEDTIGPAEYYGYVPNIDGDMEYWYNLFVNSSGIEVLP